MAEEMTIENVLEESDDAADGESDDAFAEAEDSAEDIGERARRRRSSRSSLRPSRGIRGMVMRGTDGMARRVAFPVPMATAEATNRGLAITRQALDERLDRMEKRFRAQQKNDSATSGLVSLVIGGGLAAYGAIQAGKEPGGWRLATWVANDFTRMATVSSVTQIAMSGAKFMIAGQYHRSGVGIAADIFAAAQIATVAYASLYTPPSVKVVKTLSDATGQVASGAIAIGAMVYIEEAANKGRYQVVRTSDDKGYLMPLF